MTSKKPIFWFVTIYGLSVIAMAVISLLLRWFLGLAR
jgi:hypothetical protein